MKNSDKLVLRPEQVAEVLRIGRTKVFELIGRGELPVLRLGRSVRISRRALEAWIEARSRDDVA